MKKMVNECCGCAVPAYPCIGENCEKRHVPHYYCDKCNQEFEPCDLYVSDGYDLCQECLLRQYKTLEERERE